jgi:tetratricopeptide (TPR) repeat protein
MTFSRRRITVAVAMLFVAVCVAQGPQNAASQTASATPLSMVQPGQMEVTTNSPEARALFQKGIARMEMLHWEAALAEWRKAAVVDPQFALAHIFMAMLSRDPAEQEAERERALAARKNAGAEEQLIIDWISNANQSHWVPAIQAMNEALSRYPKDKHLAWLAGLWLTGQRQSERAIPLFERAYQLDPQFADPLNQAAYCYARLGNFDKAFDHMRRYAAMLPNEANPQDSLGELSRMAGRFEDSLKYYHASLKLDPGFIDSQAGLGDTYAVMGQEDKARAEYATAIRNAVTRVEEITYALQSAATYAREQNFAKADTAFTEVAKQAHAKDLGALEAEAWRMMSAYQKDNATAMKLLTQAEATLDEPHKMTTAAREQELAIVLRTHVGRAVHDGSMAEAQASLTRLEAVAAANSSGLVQFSLSGAQGSVLLAQGKFAEAVGRLEDDDKNPFSIQRLIVAYQKTGAPEKAARMTQRLLNFYEPTIEQAVVVPQFRKSMMAMKDKN